jgi:uncharacterized protein (DUF2336 family)
MELRSTIRMNSMSAMEAAEDPRILLKLAQDRSIEGRKRLIGSISDVFSEHSAEMTEREHALMNEILRKLVREFEMSVRKELAERLAAKENAPHELIVTLANDEIEVARPILLESTVLRTPELIEIIQNRTREHQMAIAMRRSVDEVVSDALVETGDADVITTLLQNQNAQITEAALIYLVDEARRVDSYQEPLVRRNELPEKLARKMFLWVSAALRHHILEHFDIDPGELDDELEGAAIAPAPRGGEAAREKHVVPAQKLAQRLAMNDQITPDILVQSLRRGEIALFEAIFCQISGLTSPRLQRVLYEPSGKDLAICCRAREIGRSHFSVLYLLTRKGQAGSAVADPREVAKVMSYFDRVEIAAARTVLRQWQRNPEYLEAIEEVEEQRYGISPS